MRLFLILVVFFSLGALADTQVKTQVHDLDVSTEPGTFTLVFLKSGLVAKLPTADVESLDRLMAAKSSGAWFTFNLNDAREITGLEDAEGPRSLVPIMNAEKLFADYTPSVLASLDDAKKLFFDHRSPKHGETQCFNRAEVWTYEWRKNKKIYSEKIWIFFTAKYIRKNDFKWWFHVSPLVQVAIDGEIHERVMDMKYGTGPWSINQWTNYFIVGSDPCPVVTKYSDHADHPESASCFIQKTSMYYYQPADIEYLEKYNQAKTGWVPGDVKAAYLEAFDVTL